jgi:hypothetical protein
MTASARLLLGGDVNLTKPKHWRARLSNSIKPNRPERQQLGLLCLAQLRLTAAQLGADNLEGAAANLGDTLTIIAQRPSETVSNRAQAYDRCADVLVARSRRYSTAPAGSSAP